MYQKQDQEGSWADDLSDGVPAGTTSRATRRSRISAKNSSNDEWYQIGLTVEGSIADFDIVYSGNYLDRDQTGQFDYSEYSYWYWSSTCSRTISSTTTAIRSRIQSHAFSNDDKYKKTSHEIRISSPQDNRVRGLLGFFYQKQEHDFYQEFGRLEGLADVRVPNGQDPNAQAAFPGVVYLNSMDREDTDQAVFAHHRVRHHRHARALAGRALFRAGGDGQGILRFRARLEPVP